ncbi:MAG: response regulator transcription factor [Bacteroidia bacterium]|nr:response regulator transcription factor [Bacteroidia bacterium]
MEREDPVTRIVLADDHVLFRNALAALINKFDNCTVIAEAGNGCELMKVIESGVVPDLLILDLNMPRMDGFDTAKWIKAHHPEINILILTMYDTEITMIRLLQVGVKGFLKKDSSPWDLESAIRNVMQSGYCYTNNMTGKLINLFRKSQEQSAIMNSMLSDIEITFLKYACSDMTYDEIAKKMGVKPRVVDLIRDRLFKKLGVNSRQGLAMSSIRHCIYTFL